MRPDVYGTADNHLGELQRRDDHRNSSWWLESHGSQSVVRVHYGVHAVVHDDEPTCGRGVLGVREPGVDEHGYVMVPVEEDQRLFAKYDEKCVAQFG